MDLVNGYLSKKNPNQSAHRPNDCGFTLIELILVVVLIALIATFAATRIDTVVLWKLEGDIRKFAGTWEFLFNEAYGRGESYRLVINLDRNSYYVRREVPVEGTVIRQVDYLENLRTKSEKERRAKKIEEEMLSVKEEFEEEDRRQSGALDTLYYQTMFSDPEGPRRLARPLEFPSLAEERVLTDGLEFRDVQTRGEKVNSGRVFLRLSSRGSGEFAVVHLAAGETVFTVAIHPATGKVSVFDGDIDLEWRHAVENEQQS